MFHMSGKIPYQLNYKLLPTGSLTKSLIPDIKEIILRYAVMTNDRIDLRDFWSHPDAGSKLEKLLQCLKSLLELNRR